MSAHLCAMTETQPETVWLTYVCESRSPDRVCDSLETGQRLCEDFLTELSGGYTVIEDWSNVNVSGAQPRWVRWIERKGKVMEQVVAAAPVDVTGSWFRG